MGEAVAIAGKDFLTEDEAAIYCCVAKSTFCQHARSLGIQARRWMGRKVYSKADLYEAMSRAETWQRSTGAQAESNISPAPTHDGPTPKRGQQKSAGIGGMGACAPKARAVKPGCRLGGNGWQFAREKRSVQYRNAQRCGAVGGWRH